LRPSSEDHLQERVGEEIPVKAKSVTHEHLFAILNSELELSPAHSHARVLDVGCGSGHLIAFCQYSFGQLHPEANVELYGFDVIDHCIDSTISFPEGTVGELSKYFPEIPWEERILAGASGERWPFPDGHFDAIISNHVLEHLDDHDFFFSQIQRTLKPGGRSPHLFPLKNYIQEGHLKLPLVHRIKNTRLLRHYVKVLSRLGLGQYKHRRGEFASLDDFVDHQIGYLTRFTNYLEKRDLQDLATKNRLSLSFKYTYEFYLTKLKDTLRAKKAHKYKRQRSAIVDYLALTALRYLSSITIVLGKR
jgi:SAM-dependent methyltransferase